MSDPRHPRPRWLVRIVLVALALFWGVVSYDLLRQTGDGAIGPLAWAQWLTAAVSAAALGLTLRALLAQFRRPASNGSLWPRPRRGPKQKPKQRSRK